MTGKRAQLRAEMLTEIKRRAREQVASEGASQLSLRAVARDMGMASSAMYRYFDSRDQLLTALIIDTYDEIGAVVEAADARAKRSDLRGRWRAIARALRTWALDHPADFGLVFGTPVPGYAAPQDTIGPATRYTTVMLQLLADINAAGAAPTNPAPVGKGLARQYATLRRRFDLDIPDHLMRAGLAAWMSLFGAISFEVFGQLDNVLTAPVDNFSAHIDLLADNIIGI